VSRAAPIEKAPSYQGFFRSRPVSRSIGIRCPRPSLGLPEGGSDASRSLRFPALLQDRAAPGRPHLLGLRARRDRLRALPEREWDRRSAPGAAARPAALPRRRGGAAAGNRQPGPHGSGAQVLLRFCVENETLDRDPALVLRVPKKREALPDVLDRREMARLLAVTERNDVWKRHYPARRLLRELGARPGDAEWHSTTSENAGSARSAVHDSRGLGCGRWTRIGTGSRLNATS
jgi:hypothetical protein